MASPSGTTGMLRSRRTEMSRSRGFGSAPRSTCPARSACNKELRLSLRSSSGCLPTPRSWKGQSGSWRRVLLQQPTRNSLGAWGNDLPALYLLDQNVGIETLMYFDVGDMDWMSIENIPRFLAYRCSSISRLNRDGTQRLGVGLLADEATGNVLPAGEVRFTYWLLQRPCTELLTEQKAVARWMQRCFRFSRRSLPGPPARAPGAILRLGLSRSSSEKHKRKSRSPDTPAFAPT